MKVLFIHITKIILLIFIVNLYFLKVKVTHVPESIHGGNKNEIIDKSYIFNKIFLGDSRSWRLNNLAHYKISNFSSGSDSYLDMENKLKYVIQNQIVDTLFIMVDNHTLSPQREVANNVALTSILESKKNMMVFNYLPIFNGYVLSLAKAKIYSMFENIFSYNKNDKQLLLKWCELELKERKILAQKRIRTQFPNFFKSDILSKSFSRIIEICKQNRIQIIGIKMPLARSYNREVPLDYGASSILKKNGFPVYDFSHAINDSCFFDNQDHLNYDGKNEFLSNHFLKILK